LKKYSFADQQLFMAGRNCQYAKQQLLTACKNSCFSDQQLLMALRKYQYAKQQLLTTYKNSCFAHQQLMMFCKMWKCTDHRHLRNIDCLMACTACLVCFSSSVNGRSKRKRKRKEAY
jgi:hypothetical protein